MVSVGNCLMSLNPREGEHLPAAPVWVWEWSCFLPSHGRNPGGPYPVLCPGGRGCTWLCARGLLIECANGHLPRDSGSCWLFLGHRTKAFGVCFSAWGDACCFSTLCWIPAELLEVGKQ